MTNIPRFLEAEAALRDGLLDDLDGWRSVDIDYHPPRVERLYRQFGECRLSLHRVHPCAPENALFHPHDWWQVIRVLPNSAPGFVYEMRSGYSHDGEEPPVTMTTWSPGVGSLYEVLDPGVWHSVIVQGGISDSVMLNGPPMGNKSAPRPTKPLRGLAEERAWEMLQRFRRYYLS